MFPFVGNRNLDGLRLLVKERIAKMAKLRKPFFKVLTILFVFIIFLGGQTCLLCIVGELEGVGSATVAVGLADR